MIYEILFSNGLPKVFAESKQDFKVGEEVIIKNDHSVFYGEIGYRSDQSENKGVSHSILRLATQDDLRKKEELFELSQSVRKDVLKIVGDSGLDMSVVTVAYSFDKSHLFISFFAENRVDFRQLLRNLAGSFQTHIELRQIGSRDAAQIYGGIGPCGRPLCCSEFLYEFPTVSIKMAKNQQLAFSQGKLNGLCGRLMCCLSYEEEFYKQAAEEFPDFGDYLKTPEGQGRVIGMNVINRTIKLRFEDFVREYALDELELVHGR